MEVVSVRGGSLDLSLQPAFEYGILPLEGEVRIGPERFACNELAYLHEGADTISLELTPGSRLLVLGGEPFAEDILMWWNFVGFSQDEITEAQRDWESGNSRFGRVEGFDGTPLAPPRLPWA
jgi:redox-sensitive bicupin YhaK (pirin superfamily)